MLLTLRSLLEDGSAATIGNGAAVLPKHGGEWRWLRGV